MCVIFVGTTFYKYVCAGGVIVPKTGGVALSHRFDVNEYKAYTNATN